MKVLLIQVIGSNSVLMLGGREGMKVLTRKGYW